MLTTQSPLVATVIIIFKTARPVICQGNFPSEFPTGFPLIFNTVYLTNGNADVPLPSATLGPDDGNLGSPIHYNPRLNAMKVPSMAWKRSVLTGNSLSLQ